MPVFTLKMVTRRNQLEADIMVDGMDDILNSNAGGVANIVAFAMRFVLWSFSPKKRNVIILDEPFKDLSKEYQHNVAEMVSALAKKTGAQIIMVSHHIIPTNFIDNSIKVKK
jgi:DNA repair exonuclease SbcCD ATPase subunit